MHPGEIIPRHEQRLHGLVVLDTFAVAVGQASEAPHVHPNRENQPLDMRRADRVRIGTPKLRSLLGAGYRGRGVAPPGAGRKPKPVDERRDQVFSVKLTRAEKRLLDHAMPERGRAKHCLNPPASGASGERGLRSHRARSSTPLRQLIRLLCRQDAGRSPCPLGIPSVLEVEACNAAMVR